MIEIAEAARISKSGVSQILRLAPLALDVVVEAILGGWTDQGEIPEQLEQPLPLAGRSSGST